MMRTGVLLFAPDAVGYACEDYAQTTPDTIHSSPHHPWYYSVPLKTRLKTAFVPATGVHWLLPLYDPLVALCTRERKSKQKLLEQIQLESNQQIIDFGCGSGTLLVALANRATRQGHEGLGLTGVDADQRILRQAEVKLKKELAGVSPEVELLCHHGQVLPFASNTFDVCTCSLVFHHLTNEQKRETLEELRRILRPGSSFFLMDFGRPTNAFASMGFLIVRAIDGWEQTADNAVGTLPELLANAGFEEVRELYRLQTPLGTLYAWKAIA